MNVQDNADPVALPASPLPESDEALADEIRTLSAYVTAATHRMLTLLRELDRRSAWAEPGFHTCAHWLSYYTGLNMNSAREKLRVARALAELPLIDEAFRTARVSYSKVRAMTRVATAETEKTLLNIALYGTAAQLEATVRRYRRARRSYALAEANGRHEARTLELHWDDDGMLVVRGRFDPEQGAMLEQAIKETQFPPRTRDEHPNCRGGAQEPGQEPEKEQESERDGAQEQEQEQEQAQAQDLEPEPTFEQARADAFIELVRRGVTPLADGGGVRSDRGPVVVTNVHVTPQALAEPSDADPDGESVNPECNLENGPSLAAESARRLCCDGHVRRVVSGASGELLELGRRFRTVSPALKRALILRDGCCRFPGCSRTHYLDAHHIEHWAHGGETNLENLVLLCPQHHRTVHEGGVRISKEEGTLCFHRADGSVMRSVEPHGIDRDASDWLREWSEAEGLEISPRSLLTGWDGERWCPNDTVDWMLQVTDPSGKGGYGLGPPI